MTPSTTQPKMTWQTLQSQTDPFSEKMHSALEELNIAKACKDLSIDHICVRLKSASDVENLKAELLKMGQVISSVDVNGREISIIQLDEPLNLGSWQTRGLELPYPKQHHKYTDGWEHVEFVLNGAENTMKGVREAFFKRFSNLTIDELRNTYSYSESEPHAEGEQIPNPTIGLKVNGVGLKFHAKPIQVIVRFEDDTH